MANILAGSGNTDNESFGRYFWGILHVWHVAQKKPLMEGLGMAQ